MNLPTCPKCFDAGHVERLAQPALCHSFDAPYLCTSSACGEFVFEGTEAEMAAADVDAPELDRFEPEEEIAVNPPELDRFDDGRCMTCGHEWEHELALVTLASVGNVLEGWLCLDCKVLCESWAIE